MDVIEKRSYFVIALNFRSRAYFIQVVKIVFARQIDQSEADKGFNAVPGTLGIRGPQRDC